jgi:hypothetical protein
MDETLMTYALWGRGDCTVENAKALLEEYIPDNVGTIYRPERIDRDHRGLRTALDWFEHPDFLGEGGALASTDLVQSLTFDRDTQGDEVYLLALWPENPTHEEFDFIEAVQAAGITVFDLSRALDELDLSLYSRPEPTKEEKAEARAAAKAAGGGTRGRSSTRKLSDAAKEEEGEAREAQGFEEVGVTQATEGPLAKAEEVADAPAATSWKVDTDSPAFALEMAKTMLLDAIDTYVDAKMVVMFSKYGFATTTPPPTTNADAEQDMTDRPPFEGPFVGVDTTTYYWRKSADTYRLAGDTKPRRGEMTVELTPEQEADKGLK